MKRTHLVRHHVSYNPPIVIKIPHRIHQEIHGITPKISDLSLKMRQYDKLVQLSVSIKNWMRAYEREFDEVPIDVGLEIIEAKKKELLKEVEKLIKDKIKKVQHIKGLGVRYLAGLLAYAHPKDFPNVGRYLYYCGYTKASKLTKRYNRKVCGLVFQIVETMIKCKDPKYYPLYLKIKSELPREYPKIKRHRIAVNRIGTIFLKDFYHLFHE